MLDYSSLDKALVSLRRGLERSNAEPDDDELRDAVIQRFEYTYELCWKMLKRRLEQDTPTPEEIDRMSFRQLIREGATRGFVADPTAWMRYRELRNMTTHLYDEAKARRVRACAPDFETDAAALAAALRRTER